MGQRLDRLDRIARRMDGAFRLPLTRIRFGWDSVLGLVPGIGDTLTLAPAGWILLEAHRLGLPRRSLLRIAANVGLDWAVGSIPLIGDLFDVGFKANRRNAALVRAHFTHPAE
nr:DUF4112 domain-containing protein [Pseudooceanicola aestuarii]